MATEGNVVLADGRNMTFAQYGSPDGHPVLYFHGTPSSRLEPLLIGDDTFVRLGLRIIAPDRPGMGRSSFQPHRSFTHWPVDAIALADALGLGKFSVLGNSGGGVYAAACAARIPERLHSAVIVSGAWRMDQSQVLAHLHFMTRLAWRLAKHAPMLLGLLLRSMAASAGKDLTQMKSILPQPDYDAFEYPGRYEAFGYMFREALRQGTRGAAWDMRLYVHPLGVRLQDIQMPLHVFHGEKDANVPMALVRETLIAIPTAKLTTYPHEAHLSTLCNRFDDIAQALLEG
ncbi:alpha/beta fold hydrolase [Dyella caseinilytica]|uniref:Alpha/beta hydrolase n=1 Tax=Dyella caseinilytica TaxID=1849581 RepID=A0ABX7GRR1_9GAMM|nr:alpha/beta hydrolase [Dyella caseinilytica]QRN52512.1 alpha/beta hydrolase [Dyella caseinilytica]GGA06665.1 alpha/beta hydrolase [Dyella caseinilytica]